MLVKADYVAGVTIFGVGAGTANGGKHRILTASKHRNIFCLNEAFRPFITRFFTLLLGALRGPLMSACAAKTCTGPRTESPSGRSAHAAGALRWGDPNSVSRPQGVGNV